jgi:hypothetical protein
LTWAFVRNRVKEIDLPFSPSPALAGACICYLLFMAVWWRTVTLLPSVTRVVTNSLVDLSARVTVGESVTE